MSNSSILISQNKSDQQSDGVNVVVSHFGIVIICLGVVGNTITFLLFRFHPSFNTMPVMVFLSFVAVTDTLALFEWNLGHFLMFTMNFDLLNTSVLVCRLINFVQYTSLQSSALILSVMCLDRYVTVVSTPGSFLHRLPFRTIKTACFWSISVIVTTSAINFHILLQCGILFLFYFILFDKNIYRD